MLRIAFIYQFDDQAWLGGKNYFSTLFKALHAVAEGDIQVVFITGRKTSTSLPADLPFLEVVRTPLLDRWTPQWIARQSARALVNRASDPFLGALLERLGIDVLSHSEPLLTSRSAVKMIGWLPDFQFLHLPQYWTPAKTEYTHRAYTAVCRRADTIVVSSAAAQQDLGAFAPWYQGLQRVLHFVPSPPNVSSVISKDEICRRYGLPDEYFHLPNQFWRHKNHTVVIEALASMKQGSHAPVVACTGHTQDLHSPDYFDDLMKKCASAGFSEEFKVLGVVPYADMQALMFHSKAVINPSKFEGWSTSVEEAKSIGKRIVLSDIPVHREQAPAGAQYFKPDDAITLADLLSQALREQSRPMTAEEVNANYSTALNRFGQRYMQIVAETMRSAPSP